MLVVLSNFAVKCVVNLKRGKVVSSSIYKFKTIYKSDGVTYPRISRFCRHDFGCTHLRATVTPLCRPIFKSLSTLKAASPKGLHLKLPPLRLHPKRFTLF